MTAAADRYSDLVATLRENALFASCGNLLNWDEQTYMPHKGAAHRAEQLALLAGLSHERATDPRLGEVLAALEATGAGRADDESAQGSVVREARRAYDRAVKLPRRLVEEMSRTATLSQQAWIEARKKQDFPAFRPWLEKVVALKREEAAAVAPSGGVLYDALLDEYEPGASAAEIAEVFAGLRRELVPLVSAIRDSGRSPDASLLTRNYPVAAQRKFCVAAAEAIGFDFESGRLDEAAHPFCNGIGPGDCRMTTRYDAAHFPGAFFGTLHEAGHGIYEQGLDAAGFGTAPGTYCSLGIHESQSRLWENFVGRSQAFWTHFYPQAQVAFPEALTGVPLAGFHAAINDVRPSWIRVESDEVTYNLHIMLRFELEQALISGDLAPAELPGAWNGAFQRDFGMTPANDALGCLQDIHWSMGLLGYFPTYTLGNLCAAQLFESADRELGGLSEQFSRGEFRPLKAWLNETIHRRGRQYSPSRLIELVTSRPLSAEALLRHLRNRFAPLYGLAQS
ncbi:MAG: carboxypeptidase M32 [Planctomycetaceae bacterium]|nr:carboxypeptidase M32 [Planctomycetaceae bacterium]